VKYHSTEELNLQVSCRDTIIASLTAACEHAKIDTLDGLTIEYDGWWFNLRSSNTKPVIRLNIETESESLMNQKKNEVLGLIRDADPSMRLKAG